MVAALLMMFWMPETVLGKNVLTVTLANRVEPQLSNVSSIYLIKDKKDFYRVSQMEQLN